MRALESRICPVCGERFAPASARQIYCGKECSRTAGKMRYLKGPRPIKAKVCPVCGREFLPKIPNQKLCSDECRRESARISQQKSRYGEMQLRVCPVCGKEFLVTRRQYGKIYCSDECRDISRREARVEAYRRARAAKEADAADENPASAEPPAAPKPAAQGPAPAFGHRRRTMEELVRLNIEAVKLGMSYGQYMAHLERGER